MNTQILTKSVIPCNFVLTFLEKTIRPSRRDYGFDFDEEELAGELLAPLPASLAGQPIPEVEADEFEKVFQYFFS